MDEDLVGVRLVLTILDINVEFGRPRDETMTNVLRYGFVLLQLTEECCVVELPDLFDVAEQHGFLALQ